jgi:hypothetical protein
MSSVMLAADSTAIEGRHSRTAALAASPVTRRPSLLRSVQGLAAGVLFLAARVPVYIVVLLFGTLVAAAGLALYALRAVGLRLTRPAGAVAAAALALVCVAAPQRAKADTVTDLTPTSPLEQTTLVVGQQQTNLYAFDAPGAGTLSVSLKDWGFPVPLQQLTASILSQDQSWSLQPSQGSTSEWQLDLPISSGGLFDAFVAAEAGTVPGTTWQFGAYSMSISFEPSTSPVPLPPALDLLLGGVGLLGAVTLVERIYRRRNRDVISLA